MEIWILTACVFIAGIVMYIGIRAAANADILDAIKDYVQDDLPTNINDSYMKKYHDVLSEIGRLKAELAAYKTEVKYLKFIEEAYHKNDKDTQVLQINGEHYCITNVTTIKDHGEPPRVEVTAVCGNWTSKKEK